MKLFFKNLNPGSYSPHPTSIYICGVNITPKVYGGKKKSLLRCDMKRNIQIS